MRKTANDGTVFGVFAGANGHYIATEDESGTHHQPAGGGRGFWSEAKKKRLLNEAVAEHNQTAIR